jgi:hypothetical protein
MCLLILAKQGVVSALSDGPAILSFQLNLKFSFAFGWTIAFVSQEALPWKSHEAAKRGL